MGRTSGSWRRGRYSHNILYKNTFSIKNDDLVYDRDPSKPVKKWWNVPPKLFAYREIG